MRCNCWNTCYVAREVPKKFFDAPDETKWFLRTWPHAYQTGARNFDGLASADKSIESVALRLIGIQLNLLLFETKNGELRKYSTDWNDGYWIRLDDYLSGQQGDCFRLLELPVNHVEGSCSDM